MELCYRGVKHQRNTFNINAPEEKVTARFLGQTYTLRRASYQNTISSDLFKYRGIVYQK